MGMDSVCIWMHRPPVHATCKFHVQEYVNDRIVIGDLTYARLDMMYYFVLFLQQFLYLNHLNYLHVMGNVQMMWM